jgi:hypothetical protein
MTWPFPAILRINLQLHRGASQSLISRSQVQDPRSGEDRDPAVFPGTARQGRPPGPPWGVCGTISNLHFQRPRIPFRI